MNLQELQNWLGENQSVAIYAAVIFLFVLLLLYLLVRSIFSSDATAYPPSQQQRYFLGEMNDQEMSKFLEKMKDMSEEGNFLMEEVTQKIVHRQSQVQELEQHINALKHQQAELNTAITEAGGKPITYVPKDEWTYQKRRARRWAWAMLWVGLLLGTFSGVAGITAYAKYIKKQPLWGLTINGENI